MCFSATASFTAGAVLIGIGVLTLRRVNRPREVVLAAIPILFAIQQLIEGVIWLSFQHDVPRLNTSMTDLYSFFSHVLWPIYVPLAVLLIEPLPSRRRVLAVFAVGGIGVGAFLLYMLFAFPPISRITGHHIEYVMPHFFAGPVMTVYLLSTTISPIVSSHRMVKVFGVLAALAFGAAYYFYATWFISVWCLFAALLSAVIYVHFAIRGTGAGTVPTPTPTANQPVPPVDSQCAKNTRV